MGASRTPKSIPGPGRAVGGRAAWLALGWLCALVALAAPAAAATAAESGPRLVVVMVLDQFRADYLDRFRSFFGAGGFRLLEVEGACFPDCTVPYCPTVTAPGHATLLTGATPSLSGIVGNDWYERREGRNVGCDEDARVRAVPASASSAGSPWRLGAQTVGDVLRASTAGAGKVIAVSGKMRSAILSAGQHPTGAYWLDEKTGLMQTSSYYADRLPAWVEAANAARHPERAAAAPWTPLLPAAAYRGTMAAEGAPTFPHPLAAGGRTPGLPAFSASPWALERTYEFARRAVVGERLGEDEAPDLLVVSISATDRVGHLFGPDSPEVMDLAVRADRELAGFLRFLDARVGPRYTVVLTSDHGVTSGPSVARRFVASAEDSVGGMADSAFVAWMDGTLRRALGRPGAEAPSPSFVRALGDGNVWLDGESLSQAGATVAAAAAVLADSARTNPWLAAGFAAAELRGGVPANFLEERVRRGFYPGRGGDFLFVLRPYAFLGSSPTTRGDHGTPYPSDAHVPLVLYGWGVRRGLHREPVSTVDIAPTVAAILGVERPAQCEGRTLVGALALPGRR